MKRHLLVLVGFFLFLISCESTETEKETISKEHAALIGTWYEKDSLDSITWTFKQQEVKWKGFTHFYELSGDSLIISGLVYQIMQQSDERLELLKLNGKLCILNRKD